MGRIETQLNTPAGEFTLLRYPQRNNEILRAWDAADEYLLNYLSEEISGKPRILIINDNFGALAVGLNAVKPIVQTDSFLSFQGIRHNLQHNKIDTQSVSLLNSMQPLEGLFDVVVIKLPKSHAYLEDILCKITAHINSDTKIIAGAMAKNIHSSTLKLFEKIIGKTTTSLAKKKARLIFSNFTNNKIVSSPYPQCFEIETDNTTLKICNEANVFSREKLDIGTRFFLENMPDSNRFENIIDLGCGNGLLGIIAAQQNTDAKLSFSDESYMAVASAKENFKAAFGQQRKANFLVTDCLQDMANGSADLILCNPPFHQNHVVGDHIAWQMFNEAHVALKQGGEFWIVGNHHLAYHTKLKKIFGGYTVAASNKKFAVMFARMG